MFTLIIFKPFLYYSEIINEVDEVNIKTEEILSIKFCDALNKKFFFGLENESILKYEYYFSSLPALNISNDDLLQKFKKRVESKCNYKLKDFESKEFKNFINRYKSK